MKIGDRVLVNSNYPWFETYPYMGEIIDVPNKFSDYYRVAIVPRTGYNPIAMFRPEELDLVE
jgi:hypothetical protein